MRAILFILLCFSVSAFAESEYEGNRIDTLHYRAEKGFFDLGLGFNSSVKNRENIDLYNGTAERFYKSSSAETLSVSYGISDKLLIAVEENFLNNYRQSLDYLSFGFSGHENTNSFGLSDPTIRLSYRFVGGLVGTQFGSIYFDYQPTLDQAKGASQTQSGNNLSSTSEVTLGLDQYWVLENHEFELGGAVHYFSSGTLHEQLPADSVNYNSRFTENFIAAYRVHFFERFYLGVSENWLAGYSVDSTEGNVVSRSEYASMFKSVLEIGMQASPELKVSASVDYSEPKKTLTSSNAFSGTDTYKVQQSFVGIAAVYSFR